MNVDRLMDFNERNPELSPLHALIFLRWLCRLAIQQGHRARMESRRTRRQLKKGLINVFQQDRARKHLELCRQMQESIDDQLDQLGGFLSDFTRRMAVADYPPEHLAALFNIPTSRLLSKIEEVQDADRDLTVFDLVFHHAECQVPG
jgi:hypothetical protein